MKKRIIVAMGLMGATLVVAAGVAWAATVNCQVGQPCFGTDEPDTLIGTSETDDMFGYQEDDRLLGRGGSDNMNGDRDGLGVDTTTDGDDELYGSEGADNLTGYGGSDLLRGGGMADDINAQEDNRPTENPGEDTVIAHSGRDEIEALDGFKDTINCGDGVDTVFFDDGPVVFDVVADNCENRNPLP
jgi:Ca2+-binding RTX toxin-like protein